MKKYNAIFYLLFVLLVMGTFASMAQNNYGFIIMEGVALAFALVFFIQTFVILFKKSKKDLTSFLEPACLFLLALIFFLRAINKHFQYVEQIFSIAALILTVIYFKKMISRFRYFKSKNKLLAMHVIIFHMSIILFLISLCIYPYSTRSAEVIAVAAFLLLIIFIVSGFINKNLLTDGIMTTPFNMVSQFEDHSPVIVTFCLLFSLFVGLNRIGLLPGIYSDEYPHAYYELVNKASTGNEKAVDGKFKFELFKDNYDLFLKHNVKDK